jgi:hypothetical protein
VQSKDWDGITELLSQPEFDKIEDNLLKLVNGPILNTDDKKTIGTRKRYGIAADVIYGVGGVKGAIENLDNPQVRGGREGASEQGRGGPLASSRVTSAHPCIAFHPRSSISFF